MKRKIVAIISTIMLGVIIGSFVCPNLEAYANEETTNESKTLVDQDGIYVEYRGIAEYSKSSWIINLYVENNRDSEIYVSLADTLVNGFSMKLSNNGINLPAHSKYLAAPNFDLIIDTEDLEAYGITSITDIKSNLQIRTSMFGDTISETKVNLNSEPDETNASDKTVEAADESESEKDQSSTSSEYKDSNTIQRVQQALNDKGYACGTADGIAGQKTKDAISAYESSVGITVNGIITDELLQSLVLQ